MKKTAVAVALGAALAVGSIGGASAAPRSTANLSFFASSGSTAGWTDEGGDKVIALAAEAAGWAGGYFVRGGGLLSATPAPSFDTKGPQAGASGGSARLTFVLSDGGVLDVRPDAWTGGWQTVDAALGDVDSVGGSCGWAYDKTWAEAVACHAPGTTVTDVLLISDSGWLHGDFTTLVDSVSVNGKLFDSAADNRR